MSHDLLVGCCCALGAYPSTLAPWHPGALGSTYPRLVRWASGPISITDELIRDKKPRHSLSRDSAPRKHEHGDVGQNVMNPYSSILIMIRYR